MDYDRVSTYLSSLEPQDIELISDIETYATSGNFPIAKRETMSFLETTIKAIRPQKILEVGTCIAYSTLIMSLAAPEAEITTIEIGDADFEIAKKNVAKAESEGLIQGGAIKLIKGDASLVLPELRELYTTELERIGDDFYGYKKFDLVFMDAAKGQYLSWLPDVLAIMNEGGVLISDNVFQDDNIFESRFAVERRDRTIHKRMREYLYELKHNKSLQTSILPVGDGVAFTVKLKN